MDWNCANFCLEKKKKELDRFEIVEDLLRSCWAWRKQVFQREEKHIEMNAKSKLLKHRSNQHIKLSKHLSIYMQSIKKKKKKQKQNHTHTKNKSNQFYISKTSYDRLVSIH